MYVYHIYDWSRRRSRTHWQFCRSKNKRSIRLSLTMASTACHLEGTKPKLKTHTLL